MKYKKATPEYVFHCQVPKPASLFLPPWLQYAWNITKHSFPLLPQPLLPSHCEFTKLAFVSTTAFIYKHVLEKTRGARPERSPSTAAGLCVWGRAGYHVHLNKGSVFRRASWESSWAPSLLSLIIMLAPRLLHQDELSRTTCCCLQSGCRCRHAAKVNQTEQKCECSFLCASKLAQKVIYFLVRTFVNKVLHEKWLLW